MSMHSTIFLTEDNEHCYIDYSSPIFDNSDVPQVAYPIMMEVNRENIKIHKCDDGNFILEFTPNTDMYIQIKSIEL